MVLGTMVSPTLGLLAWLFVPGNMAAVPQPCCQPPAKLLPCVSPALKSASPTSASAQQQTPGDGLISAQPHATGPQGRASSQDLFCESVQGEGMAALNRWQHVPPERCNPPPCFPGPGENQQHTAQQELTSSWCLYPARPSTRLIKLHVRGITCTEHQKGPGKPRNKFEL